MVHPFLRKLRHGAKLTAGDEEQLMGLLQVSRNLPAQAELLNEGTGPHVLPLIIDGWAARYRQLENGKRQIITTYLPGDLCEPFGMLPKFVDHPVVALTPTTVVRISLRLINDAARASSRINMALWWDLLFASAIEREHVVSLGRRSALERLAHLLCELRLRLELVGLTEGLSYDLPLTQADLADLLGLSTVHVNRSLQELRRMGVISLVDRRLMIHDLEQLEELSFFDAAYPHPEGLS